MGKGIINKEELRADAGKQIDRARLAATLLNHAHWKIFLAIFRNKQREIGAKDDYPTLEDFRADRGAIRIVKEMIEELESYVDDSASAEDIIKALNKKADHQTSDSILSLDLEDEGERAAEG